MTHNDPTTCPRLADPLGWIPAAGLLAVHFVGASDHDADESTADAVVRRFADLPAVLGSLVCPGC